MIPVLYIVYVYHYNMAVVVIDIGDLSVNGRDDISNGDVRNDRFFRARRSYSRARGFLFFAGRGDISSVEQLAAVCLDKIMYSVFQSVPSKRVRAVFVFHLRIKNRELITSVEKCNRRFCCCSGGTTLMNVRGKKKIYWKRVRA